MISQHYRAILLTLLISTNLVAMDQPQNNFPRRLLTAFAGTLFLLARLVTNYFSANSSGHNFYSSGNINISQSTSAHGNVYVINDELTISAKNLSQQDLGRLPLIKSSGTIETIELNAGIEHVKIPGTVALVTIDDTQTPRYVLDAAFKNDLIIKTDNGILTVSTPNNEPRKFAYNGQPLCIIYAKLLTLKLCASDNARVIIINQKIETLTSTNSSHITGSINAMEQLKLTCLNSSYIELNDIRTGSLTIKSFTSSKLKLSKIDTDTLNTHATASSEIFVAGKAKNQILKAYTSSIINGKQLIAQGGSFNAEASDSSKIFAAGRVINPTLESYNASVINGKELTAQGDNLYTKASNGSIISVGGNVKKHTLIASNASMFDGSSLNVDIANVNVTTASKANYSNVHNQLNGQVSMASMITYQGTPHLNIKKDITSKCTRN